MKLEDKLKGICPTCKKETTFQYLGEMYYKRKDKTEDRLKLYNCEYCKSTISLKRIYNENTKIM